MKKTCYSFACLLGITLAFWFSLLVKVFRRKRPSEKGAIEKCQPSDVILTGEDTLDQWRRQRVFGISKSLSVRRMNACFATRRIPFQMPRDVGCSDATLFGGS